MLKLLLFILTMLFLTACSNSRIAPVEVPLTQDINFRLLSPSSFGEQLSISQLIEYQYDGDNRELLTQSEFLSDKMVIVGLTTGGTRLFTIIYDGTSIDTEGYIATTKELQLEYMLIDIQLSLWPIDEINQHLVITSKCFSENRCSFFESTDKLKRTLIQNGEEILTIIYNSQPAYQSVITLNNKLRNYQLSITPMSVDKL